MELFDANRHGIILTEIFRPTQRAGPKVPVSAADRGRELRRGKQIY